MQAAKSVLELIGHTPLLRLSRVAKDVPAEVLVKAEYLNPSGSVKDRVAFRMIEEAERSGALKPGMTIVEASTGNMAAALAFVGAIKGYKVHIFFPAVAASEERLRIIRSYGAAVTLIGEGGEQVTTASDVPTGALHGAVVEKTPRRICLAVEQANPDKIWWARQASNPANTLAHEEGTAREIIEQAGGKVDVFCAAIGTCGTLLGCGKALRRHNPEVLLVAVEPRDQAMFRLDGKRVAEPPPGDPTRSVLMMEFLGLKIAGKIIHVEQQQAIDMAHRLSEEEGLFCGLSAGANVFAALQLAGEMKPGQRVVTVLPDSRDRYLFKERFTT